MAVTKNNMLTCPSVGTLLKAFHIFNECGLIKEDLQFDPEHYIRTVVIPGWNSILENKESNHTMQNCKFARNFPKCNPDNCSSCPDWESWEN